MRGTAPIALLLVLLASCSVGGPSVDGGTDAGEGEGEDAGLPAPPDLGPGFVELSKVFVQRPPIRFPPGPADERFEPVIAAAVDLDGTGPDEVLVVGYAQTAAYRIVGEAMVVEPRIPFATRGLVGVIDVDGDGHDELVSTQEWGGDDTEAFAKLTHTIPIDPLVRIAVAPADLDEDGLLDFLGGTAQCCAECQDTYLMHASGGGRYRRVEGIFGPWTGVSTQAILATQLHGRALTLSLGNACTPFHDSASAVRERTGWNADGFPTYAELDLIAERGRSMLSASPLHPPMEISDVSPMGGAAGDLDGDGDLDLFLSLAHHAVFETRDDGLVVDRWDTSGLDVLRLPERPDQPQTPWGAAMADIDGDGRQDVVVARGHDFAQATHPLVKGILQYNGVLLNLGGFRFVEAREEAGFDVGGNFEALFQSDFDRDGRADAAFGGIGYLPAVYLNRVSTGNRFVSIRLRGTTSNGPGLGTKLVARIDGLPDQHFVASSGGSPFLFAPPLVFIGLGRADEVRELELTWPSGTVQRVGPLAAGRQHVVEEPRLLQVEPAERRVPAVSGRARLSVFAPESSSVTVRVSAGEVVPLEVPRFEDGAWRVEVAAAQRRSSSVLEVTIDGRVVGIRPRIWFDEGP